jgi:hypothetical protein
VFGSAHDTRRWKTNAQMDANQNVRDAWAPGCKFGGAAALNGVLPGLKPMLICRLYAGVETPASLRFGFFTELNPFSQWILRIAERKPEFNQIR